MSTTIYLRQGNQLAKDEFGSIALGFIAPDLSDFQKELDAINKISLVCQINPSQKLVTRINNETRDVWGSIWSSWLRHHDAVLTSLDNLVPSFEAAKDAVQAFVDSTDNANSQVKDYGSHLLRSVTWRWEIARVLMDTKNRSQFEREKEVNRLHGKASER